MADAFIIVFCDYRVDGAVGEPVAGAQNRVTAEVLDRLLCGYLSCHEPLDTMAAHEQLFVLEIQHYEQYKVRNDSLAHECRCAGCRGRYRCRNLRE